MKMIWEYLYKPKKDSSIYFTIKINKVCEKYTNVLIIHPKKMNKCKIYKEPVNASIEGSPEFKIYSIEDCINLANQLIILNYSIVVNGQIYSKEINFEEVKYINAKKELLFEDENFKRYIYRKITTIKLKKGVQSIEKELISFYFDEIILNDKSNKNFNVIIDDNRLELMERINKFFYSQDLFYWIMGSDGIGKTVTVLVFSSLLRKYKILYLNVKLFYKKNYTQSKNIFLNEIKRIFLTNENGEEELSYLKYIYQILISKMITEKSEVEDINIFWQLLFKFLEIYNSIKLPNLDILIIVDQYKSLNYDKDFAHLNKLTFKISEMSKLTYRIKLLLISSINNFDIKTVFLENLYILSFETSSFLNDNLLSLFRYDVVQKKKMIIDEATQEDEDYELKDIENVLNDNIEKNKNKFEKYLNNSFKKENNYNSVCYLNRLYSKITKKEYFNNFITCEEIIDEKLGKNFKHCISVFKYSFKYYELLLKEIKDTKKNTDEKDEDFEIKVLKSFYNKMFSKILSNLKKFYEQMYSTFKNSTISFEEFFITKLIQLRENIYEEKMCSIDTLSNLLKYYPVKYLNVYLCGIDKNFIPIDNINIGNDCLFYYDYSNSFIRYTINKIINIKSKEFSKINLEGCGFGAEFESRVNSSLEKFFEGNITKRNIFAFVGTTQNSIKYVKEMRQNESLFFNEFFELKRFNISIDGIDNLFPINIDIKNKNVHLNQVSNIGRSFDSALLLKIENEVFTHNLILFQIKLKASTSKTKDEYIKDCLKSKKYLEKLYDGLMINEIYFVFILPLKMPGIEQTINILESNNIYYIFYSYVQNKLYDIEGNQIHEFFIKEAKINDNNIDFSLVKALSDNIKSKNDMKKAIMNFLGKKRLYNNMFIEPISEKEEKIIYKRNKFNTYIKASEGILFSPRKVIIPLQIKKNIIAKLYEKNYFTKDTHINFIFSSNYRGTKIINLYNFTKNVILFSYNDDIYLYYSNYYKIKEDYTLEETENLVFPNKIKKIMKPKQNIKFNDIKKYPLFCFCYRIIIDYNFD